MLPILFSAFGHPVRSYGFFMTLAHLAGIGLLFFLARSEKKPVAPLIDVFFATIVCGLIGARLGYAYNQWSEFSGDPWSVLSLRKDGLSFYGGFAPAFLAFTGMLYWKRLPVLDYSDLLAPVLPFTLAIMRLGCFLQGCCYGAPFSAPWAVRFTRVEGQVPPALMGLDLHPSQLYEAGFLFLLAALLFVLRRRVSVRPGVLATFSVFAYCMFRLTMDFHRGDLTRGFWGLSWLAPTQAAAILGIAATPVVLLVVYYNAKSPQR